MFRISAEQLESSSNRRFEQTLTQIICQHTPDGKGAVDTPAGQKILEQQIQKARSYGMRSELEIANYVIAAWLLGPDFDHRFPAMSEILHADTLPPLKKAEALEKVCMVLFTQLQSSGA